MTEIVDDSSVAKHRKQSGASVACVFARKNAERVLAVIAYIACSRTRYQKVSVLPWAYAHTVANTLV